MSTMSVRLPNSFHKRLRLLAERENISMNQLIMTALAEKLSALDTHAYLEERADRAGKKRFRQALKKISNIEPEPEDRL